MSERLTLFVEVVLPIPMAKAFTYRVPFELNDQIQRFVRVIVPFGKSKFYTGIITSISETSPKDFQAKYIEFVLDDEPIIYPAQYSFWQWVANYYLAPIGDVMNAALPSYFKLASETKVVLHPDFEEKNANLTDRELLIVDALSVQEELNLSDISQICGVKTVQPIIKRLIDLKVIITREDLSERFSEKKASFIVLEENYKDDNQLSALLEELSKKTKDAGKEKVILTFLHLSQTNQNEFQPIDKKDLIRMGCSESSIKSLIKQQVLRQESLVISRLNYINEFSSELPKLSEKQALALDQIIDFHTENKTVLLDGVTGSGKTALYMHLIAKTIKENKQVLFLVPEIALTTQLIDRLAAVFGKQVGVYHSRFNSNERIEIWNKIKNNSSNENKSTDYQIVVGARSSIFLPFNNLGLVIVDEEHESSFKQYEPSPRYNARDMSMVLAQGFKAKVVLGSATPSIETVFKAKEGKFGHVYLTERFSKVEMPEIFVADLKKEKASNQLNGSFSSFLISEIKTALSQDEQVILFQNRRGYNPFWSCEVCQHTPNCVNCDTTLNYHKTKNVLLCHYCGYSTSPMGSCTECGSNRLSMNGFGTERIEDELSLLFPDARIGRMDQDTTRTKNSHQKIITNFQDRNIDILIGTQMVAKGLDFDNVRLVGIIDADMLLKRTDFRAFEKAFQLMSQVAGRAGRREKRGIVVVQTHQPDHWLIERLIDHDYERFVEFETSERRNYHYPPFYKLIRFTLKHPNREKVENGSQYFGQQLRSVFNERVIGPEYPIIPRINNQYIQEIILKIENEAPLKKVKERLVELTDQFYSVPDFKPIRLTIDVDPA
jgi:primosomal protein N' (replication factor Y)